MDLYTVAWLSWLGIFVVIEGTALFNKRDGDTFSDHIWSWFAVKDKTAKFWQLRRTVLLVSVTWIAAHFLTGGWV